MDAQAQADMQALLDTNNKRKKIQDIPTYYGNGKDTITGRYLVERIDSAAVVTPNAAWNDARRILELGHCLQGPALCWFRAMKNNGRLNWETWNVVKETFLKRYDPTASTRTAVQDLEKLKQRPDELVGDFYTRVDEVFEKLNLTMPDTAKEPTAEELAVFTTQANKDQSKVVVKRCTRDAVQWVQQQVFIHGLTEPLRFRVQEAATDNLLDCYNTALDQELIYSKEKRSAKINAVQDVEDESDMLEAEPEDEAHLNAINHFRQRRGLPPRARPAHWGRSAGSSNAGRARGPVDLSKIKCRYKPCSKFGHFQKDCPMRIKDKAVCVDASGKPWNSQPKVNEITEGAEAKISSAHLNYLRVV